MQTEFLRGGTAIHIIEDSWVKDLLRNLDTESPWAKTDAYSEAQKGSWCHRKATLPLEIVQTGV